MQQQSLFADVLLSCMKLPRCWERKEGGWSEREREREGGDQKEKEVGGRRSSGEGVAQRTDDVVVTHPKTLQLSLSGQQRAGPERKMEGSAGGGGPGKCGARSTLLSGMRAFPPPTFA